MDKMHLKIVEETEWDVIFYFLWLIYKYSLIENVFKIVLKYLWTRYLYFVLISWVKYIVSPLVSICGDIAHNFPSVPYSFYSSGQS